MDEYLNNRHKEIFLRLLTNPADTGGVYLVNLQELVKAHPQSGLLRAMYGRALNESTPVVAGGYFDNRALHKLLHHQDGLLPVAANQVIVESKYKSVNGYAAVKDDVAEDTEASTPEPVIVNQESSSEMLTDQPTNFPEALKESWPAANTAEGVQPQGIPVPKIAPTNVQIAEPVAETHQPETAGEEPLGRAPWEMEEDDEEETAPLAVSVNHPEVNAEPATEKIEEELTAEPDAAQITQEVAAAPPAPVAERTPWELIAEEYASHAAHTNGQASYAEPVGASPENHIDEETYDEITGIDDIAINNQSPGIIEQPAVNGEVDDLIKYHIAGTDHFLFEHAFSEQLNGVPVVSQGPEKAPEPNGQNAHEGLQLSQPVPEENGAHHNDVSKYHDEKMPYTFMWWLDKTRKEHDANYQPYVKAPNNNGSKPGKRDDLQQQYFENIFHLSPMDSLAGVAEPQTIEFDMHNKEDRLIKRFITEDPHIHPPLGERLDTENKAKRSSEDDFDMVTETLARIYADQMLFPKAIATYRKLMLKFPEKSRYFASRIDALEKRTN